MLFGIPLKDGRGHVLVSQGIGWFCGGATVVS